MVKNTFPFLSLSPYSFPELNWREYFFIYTFTTASQKSLMKSIFNQLKSDQSSYHVELLKVNKRKCDSKNQLGFVSCGLLAWNCELKGRVVDKSDYFSVIFWWLSRCNWEQTLTPSYDFGLLKQGN